MADTKQHAVLIVGGGPAGLVLAIELGRRGVPCIVFDQESAPPAFPKANNSTARTMEHYRRLGFADEIRTLGLPEDHPSDVSYHTRYSRHGIARLHWPSRREVLANRQRNDPRWPTPEPLHRGQQMFIEATLRRQAARWPAIELRFGWRVETISQDADGVEIRARDAASGALETFRGDYAVGCDGPRSMVREAIGVRYEGHAAEERDFMGGRMLACYFRSPEFYQLGAGRSWQYWAINHQRRGAAIAIDGERFVLHTQLPRGTSGTLEYARETLEITAGTPFSYEMLGTAEWTAGFTLVAERYRNGRIFLAGDAAHLFTPTAGQGYNTSVDDVANLGWKLAAVWQGWGGPALLESYGEERKPIGERNTRFARSIAEHFKTLHLPSALEDDSQAGEAARAEIGRQMQQIAALEFDIPGITFGMFYAGSRLVAREHGAPPIDDPHNYVQHAMPGARAPHVWLGPGEALFDRFGRDFTLLKLDSAQDTEALEGAAQAKKIPLAVAAVQSDEAREAYRAGLALIRPDHFVAWRGERAPADPGALLDMAVGCTNQK